QRTTLQYQLPSGRDKPNRRGFVVPHRGCRLHSGGRSNVPECIFPAVRRSSRHSDSPEATLMTVYLTRIVRFNAAHRYHRPEWSEERNRATFGACNNPHGHGHNYRLEVMVGGEPAPVTGFSIDLPALDAILQEEVVNRFDHQHLNH